MIKIFIAEEIPSHNKGEAAIMHGIKETIAAHAKDDVLFFLCSRFKERDQKEYGPQVKVIDSYGMIPRHLPPVIKRIRFTLNMLQHLAYILTYRFFGSKITSTCFKNELWKAYSEADIIIVGHDNAFTRFHFPLILFAHWLGKKVSLYGTTIMPIIFESKFFKKFGRWVLNRVDLITTRELRTYHLLKAIGVDGVPLYCTADKAFILKSIKNHEANLLIGKLGLDKIKKPYIGVMVARISTVYRAAFKGWSLSKEEKYEKHAAVIAAALNKIIKEIDVSIVFLGHCVGPDHERDDRIVARAIKDKITVKDRTMLIMDDLSASELKAIMGTCNMVVTERTHGGIGAATMNVPTLWITHPGDPRTHGIVAETLGLPQCLYNIENLNQDSLAQKIKEVYEERESIKKILGKNVENAQKLTMKNGEYFSQHLL